MPPTPPRVFISYRHDTPEHAARVLALADRLRADGVDAWIDVYEPWPADGWRAWMRGQLTQARWVVCVGSPGYRIAAEGRGSGRVGRGAGFEGSLLDQELYDQHGHNHRVIPVLFADQDEAELPDFLLRYRRYTIDAEYDALYALLTDQARGAPPLGALRELEHHFVAPAPVRGVGARPAATSPPPLADYLRWVARYFDAVPTFDADTEAALTDLYVGLSGADVGGRERHLLDDLIRRNPGGRWTLQGDPGAGKSTLLRHLAVTLAREAAAAVADGRDPGPASVPVLVNLAELGEGPLVGAVLHRVIEAYGRDEPDPAGVRAALEAQLRGGGVLFLLDGLDEVDPTRHAPLLAALRELSRLRTECGLVLTSRRFGYQRPDKRFREVELLPLDRAEQEALFTRILGPEAAAARLAEIDQHASLQDLAANPFTLTLLGVLARAGGPLPARRATVYQRVLDHMIGRSLSSVRQVDASGARRVLQDLALRLVEQGVGPWRREELDAHAPSGVLDLAGKTRLLVPHPDGRWRFAHRTLLECLAAEAVVRAGVDTHVEALGGGVWWKPWTLRKAADVGRWGEVYALVAALDPDPGARLDQLVKVNRDLARRAVVGMDEVPVERLQAVWGVDRPGALVRELLQRMPDRDAAARALLALGLRSRDRDAAGYAAAGLLLLDRPDELATLRRRRDDHLGVPDRPWVEVPPGEFWMGSPDGVGHDGEHPRQRVRITHGLRVLATPVTQALYEVVAGSNPAHFTGDVRRPVETVSWFDAVRWCNALSAAERRPTAYSVGAGDTPEVTVDLTTPSYRLPTEAEWEYLCRAGTDTRWSCGDDEAALGDHAWFHGNAGRTTHPVGEKRPNPWGLYDVHGNVAEWCGDETGRMYTNQPVDDPFLPPAVGGRRVIRGGSWSFAPVWCRSAFRVRGYPDGRGAGLGFRVVLPLPRGP